MEDKLPKSWQKMLNFLPWSNAVGPSPLTAYWEYMPLPRLGRKPLGRVDHGLFAENDPYWRLITEIEEENCDIGRSGYHDTKDTQENIELDCGAALAAVAIGATAHVACSPILGLQGACQRKYRSRGGVS